MNNGVDSLLSFIEGTPLKKLLITTCRNMKECRQRLANHNKEAWEAIILDAVPKMDNISEPTTKNLGIAFLQVKSEFGPPVFIVANNKEELNDREIYAAECISGNRFYMLQDSTQLLYNEIVKVVGDNEEAIIRRKYEAIYDFYMSINDSDELLIKLLKGLESDILYKDPSIPGIVRLILDGIMIYLNNENILPIKFTGSNLAKCSTWLGDKYGEAKDIVPIHVQRSFHSCVEIANNGDHQIPKESEYDYEKRISNPLYVQKQISDCKAPYLNKALIYDLLNILYWCATYKR